MNKRDARVPSVADIQRLWGLAAGTDDERATVEAALLGLGLEGWLRLDQEVRWSTWTDHDAVRARGVPDLAGEPTARLALRTMSASGFIREAAIRAIAGHASPVVAPCLVLRCADWVPEVAGLARRELLRRAEADDATVAQALPLAIALVRRVRAGDLVDALLGSIGSRAACAPRAAPGAS